MKTHIAPAIRLTIALFILLAVIYPLMVAGIARFAPGGGAGEKTVVNGRVVGYANIGQKFTEDRYFNSRPSAVDYNAAGSAGSKIGRAHV